MNDELPRSVSHMVEIGTLKRAAISRGALGPGMTLLGKTLFSFGLGGLGVVSLIYDDYAMVWQPVPPWVPHREILAYASGALLLLASVGAFFRRTARLATIVLTAFVFSWLLLLQVPRVLSDPSNEGMWLGFGETLLLVSGGWVLISSSASNREGGRGLISPEGTSLRVGRRLFGAALPLIGLSHFIYSAGTASMVPAWLPGRLFFAYLTGAGHIAAGAGILLGILPGLAASLEATMITLFVLLLHLPGVILQPRDRLQWTMFFIAVAYAGSAWAVAGSSTALADRALSSSIDGTIVTAEGMNRPSD